MKWLRTVGCLGKSVRLLVLGRTRRHSRDRVETGELALVVIYVDPQAQLNRDQPYLLIDLSRGEK
jgi:hypothetical protein